MDNYVPVERLGQGSFAVVWKSRRKADNRLVAVKQLRQAPATWDDCKRFPEIKAAAAVRAPYVIALLEAVRHGGELFLVFEHATLTFAGVYNVATGSQNPRCDGQCGNC